MQIESVTVDWMEQFANDPRLIIEIDTMPTFIYKAYPFEHKTLYMGISEGVVDFFMRNPLNENGFGGRVLTLPMENGAKVTITGPWSSNSRSVYDITGIKTMPVILVHDGRKYAGHMLVDAICETLKSMAPELQLCRAPHNSCDFMVKKRGQTPKNPTYIDY